jgi:hypothetical protein
VLGSGKQALIHTPPFTGPWAPRIDERAWGAIATGAAVVIWGPRATRILPWRWLLIASAVVAAVWAVCLAWIDGTHTLVQPLLSRFDYLHELPKVANLGSFVRTFVPHILDYNTQIRGHPPGFELLLWVMDRAGLQGARPEAALVIAGGAAAVPAALLATREVAGERTARGAAPFLAVAPMAVTIASSADALYMGVGAWGLALMVLATGREGRREIAFSLAGGAVFGCGLLLTYGLAPLAAIPVVVAVARRRLLSLLLGAVGIAVVLGAFAAAGFWWLAGLERTRAIYDHNVGSHRPYSYFLIGDLAVLAVMVGPATAAGVGRLVQEVAAEGGIRRPSVLLLVVGALLAVAAADLSGLSKGEVERIWLPFAPWLLVSCALLPETGTSQNLWLGANVLTGLLFQLLLRSPF